MFRLYQNKAAASKSRRTYRSRPELAVDLLHLLCNQRKARRFHVVADSAYGGQSVLCNLPENCGITSRLMATTRLYDPPPAPEQGRRGRPRMRGDRLPSPAELLEGRCRRVTFDIYGRCQKARVAYRDVKQSLGFKQPQGWCRKTVERTAPMAMLIYSLVIIWFAREGHRHWQPAGHAWYATKRDPSFADMLAELRRRSVRRCILSLPLETLGPRKLFRILENAVGLAA